VNAKHQFKYSYNEGCEDFSPVDITFDMPGDITLQQMLYNFQSYLKAVGFVFDGELEIVDHTFDVMDEVDGALYEIDKQEEFEKQWDKACGCPVGLKGIEGEKGVETSEFNKQFDITRTTASSEDGISTEEYQKRRNWTQAEKMLKEWNKGIAGLDKEVKEQREIREKASLRADELKQMEERWKKVSNEKKASILADVLKASGL